MRVYLFITVCVPILAAALACVQPLPAEKPPSKGMVMDAIVLKVYDGDTITVQPVLPEVRVRLLDCWAPEIRTLDAAEKVKGFESRDNLRSMLKDGDRVRLHVPTTHRLGDSLTLGRVLGKVWIDVDGDGVLDNVSTLQVRDGHATATKGGGR